MSTAELRKTFYLLLTVIATAIAVAKIIGAENVVEPSRFDAKPNHPRYQWPQNRPEPYPMFGSNDKSRWATVRALVDHGTFVIGHRNDYQDPKTDVGLVFENGWSSIDKVMNPETHDYYSSKPPIYAVMLAGEYWALKKCLGWSIVNDRWLVICTILLTVNALPFAVSLVLLSRLIEQYGTTDFGKLLAFSVAAFGTFTLTFSNTLNNHTPAVACVIFTLYPLLRFPDTSRRALFMSGFFAAMTVTFEMPAACFSTAVLLLAIARFRLRATAFVLGALIPAIAFFASNYAALGRFMPAYSDFGGPWYNFPGSHWAKLDEVKAGAVHPGIDFAQESRQVYLFHCLLGHHGWFSLTPIWLLGLIGIAVTIPAAIRKLESNALSFEMIVQLAGAVTVILTVFFVFVQKTNNYGGNTSCLRWFLWTSPLWVLATLSGADRLAYRKWSRGLAAVLLAFSVMSVFYPAWNPWRSPWIQVMLERAGLVNYDLR